MTAMTNPAGQIGLLIYPDCQLAAVHGLTDLFRIAGEWGEDRDTSGGPAPFIRITHWTASEEAGKVECTWDSHPGHAHRLSHVIAPPSIVMPERMRPMPACSAWMKDRHKDGCTLASVCAGAFVLAETGLLEGRRATTHWAFAPLLAERFPQIQVAEARMVLDDGDVMTAGGILAWTDLGLTLVERLLGPSVMLATARFLLIDPPRLNQKPFALFLPRFDHGDAAVRRAQHQIHARPEQAPSVGDLAGIAGLSERTFLRRFSKATGYRPVEYVQQVRVAKARKALELTNTSVDRIAWSVGYTDPAAFRKVFLRITGLSPGPYRRRFSIA